MRGSFIGRRSLGQPPIQSLAYIKFILQRLKKLQIRKIIDIIKSKIFSFEKI